MILKIACIETGWVKHHYKMCSILWNFWCPLSTVKCQASASCHPSVHDVKRSAVASHRCDLSPERSLSCQLQSIGHWYSRVSADLMNLGSGRSSSSMLPYMDDGSETSWASQHVRSIWFDRIVWDFVTYNNEASRRPVRCRTSVSHYQHIVMRVYVCVRVSRYSRRARSVIAGWRPTEESGIPSGQSRRLLGNLTHSIGLLSCLSRAAAEL